MAMAVDRRMERAFTVSADHLLCRYNLREVSRSATPQELLDAKQYPGNLPADSTAISVTRKIYHRTADLHDRHRLLPLHKTDR